MSQQHSPQTNNIHPWLAILLTIIMVIVVRELCVLLCGYVGVPRAANIVGLVVMFLLLFTWRWVREHKQTNKQTVPSLPTWLTNASNRLLLDSGLAFLPISAGAGLLLFGLGDELWGVLTVIFVSTLVPLWAIAKLSDYWLNKPSNHLSDTTSNNNAKEGR